MHRAGGGRFSSRNSVDLPPELKNCHENCCCIMLTVMLTRHSRSTYSGAAERPPPVVPVAARATTSVAPSPLERPRQVAPTHGSERSEAGLRPSTHTGAHARPRTLPAARWGPHGAAADRGAGQAADSGVPLPGLRTVVRHARRTESPLQAGVPQGEPAAQGLRFGADQRRGIRKARRTAGGAEQWSCLAPVLALLALPRGKLRHYPQSHHRRRRR